MAPTSARNEKVLGRPLADRWILKPVSLFELSVQVISIWLDEIALAAVFVGATGVAQGVAVGVADGVGVGVLHVGVVAWAVPLFECPQPLNAPT